MTGGLTQMIQLITSADLIVELFNSYAPSMEIEKIDLGHTPVERANNIFSRMEKFVVENPAEHSAIFKVLNTIAVVNTDPNYQRTILQFLDSNSALKKVYNSVEYARTFSKRRPIAAMAAFVAVQCKSKNSSVSAQAQMLWQQFIIDCSKVAQGGFYGVNITPPTKSGSAKQVGLQQFQAKLESYIRLNNQQHDYIALIVPNQTAEGYTRYYVNTSPPDRDVLQVQDGEPRIGKDTNMTGFEIRHYFITNRVRISETKAGDQHVILNLFLEHVLGSRIDRRHRLHCEHRLPLFRTAERFQREITLPKDISKAGELAYISQMIILVSERQEELTLKGDNEDTYTPTTFTGTASQSIHDQIAKQLQDRFPPELWNIKFVEVTVLMHPYIYDKTSHQPLGRSTDFTKVRFPIKPGGCTPKFEHRHRLDPMLHQDAMELRKLWRLDGVSEETFMFMSEAERNGEI